MGKRDITIFTCAMLLASCTAAVSATGETHTYALLKETESFHREFRVEQPYKRDNAVVIVVEQPLQDFVRLAARHNGLDVHLSGVLEGTLKNASLPLSIRKLMPRLANRFDLAWHISGRELFVSRASETITRELRLDGIDMNELHKLLRDSGLEAGKHGFSIEEIPGRARLVGTPSHVEAIFGMVERYKNRNGIE